MLRIRTYTGWKRFFCNNPIDGGDGDGIDLGEIGMDFGGGGEVVPPTDPPADTPPATDPPADDAGDPGDGGDPHAGPVADDGGDNPPTNVDDPPATPPADDDPPTTPPADDGGDTPPPTDGDTPPADDDTPPDTMEELRRQLNDLHAQILEGTPATPAKPPEGTEPPAGAAGQGEVDYLGELDIDDVVSKPELFNQVIQQSVDTAVQRAVQMVVGNMAQLTQPIIRQTISMDRKIDNFFEEHPLLGNFRQVVGGVANQAQAQNPEASFDDLLPKIAEMAYKALQIDPAAVKKLQEQQNSQQTTTPRETGLPSSTSTRTTTPAQPKLSDIEQEIDDLMNLP